MYPVICRIGPFTVYSYGLMVALGFTLSLYLVSRHAQREGIDQGLINNLGFIILLGGIVGARVLFVALHFENYASNLKEIFFLQQGGLSWFGAFFSGGLAGYIYLKRKGLSFYKTLDLIIPYVALGQAIGRIGCLLNGCCFGPPSSYGIYFSVHQAVLIPIQIYSSLGLLAIFLILRLIQKNKLALGFTFFSYLLLYSLMRFFLEFWRIEHPKLLGGLTVFQLISLIIFLFSLQKLIIINHKR